MTCVGEPTRSQVSLFFPSLSLALREGKEREPRNEVVLGRCK